MKLHIIARWQLWGGRQGCALPNPPHRHHHHRQGSTWPWPSARPACQETSPLLPTLLQLTQAELIPWVRKSAPPGLRATALWPEAERTPRDLHRELARQLPSLRSPSTIVGTPKPTQPMQYSYLLSITTLFPEHQEKISHISLHSKNRNARKGYEFNEEKILGLENFREMCNFLVYQGN